MIKPRKSYMEVDPDPGLTPLMKAVLGRDVDSVRSQLSTGLDLEFRDRLGRNVLYHAFPNRFCDKSVEIFEMLLEHGININASLDSDGCSALVTAVEMNEPQIVSLLIAHGVDVNDSAMSKFCGSLCSNTSERNYLDDASVTTQFFFSKGCEHTVTPLLCAVMCKFHIIADTLLAAGAKTSCLSSGSFWRAANISVCSICEIEVNPIHMAAYIGDVPMTRILLDHQALMPVEEEQEEDDFEDDDAYFSSRRQLSYNDITPLWFALLRGHEHIVKLFLARGRPVAPPCHFGSGLQVCLQEGHTSLALMILRAGYDLEDDLEWIENGDFPTEDVEVKNKIVSLLGEPRPLLEWCCLSLWDRFGPGLDQYLSQANAPQKICDVLTFNDLLKSSQPPSIFPPSLDNTLEVTDV